MKEQPTLHVALHPLTVSGTGFHPDEFRWFREQGEALGFGSVFSGPLVRSSYRADEQRHAAETGRGAVAY